MKMIAIYNNKGGVGKSTTAINVAYILAEVLKKTVLVIDCDGQQNTSRFFADTLPNSGFEQSLLHTELSPVAALCQTRYQGIDVLTSSEAMNTCTEEFSKLSAAAQEYNLAKLCSSFEGQYDYVLLDMPEGLSALAARQIAQSIQSEDCPWSYDGILTSAYIGTDAISAYLSGMENNNKDLFVVLRTSNRTAPQMQDLLTGGRLAYMAMADQLNRLGDKLVTRGGYSRLAAVGAAASVDCLRSLRTRYKTMFLLLDGSDYPNANMKNCSAAFDQLGRGAVACVGLSVTAAWQAEESDGKDYVECACRSVDRIKKNLARYVTVL